MWVGRIDFYRHQLASLNRALAAMHWLPLDPTKLSLTIPAPNSALPPQEPAAPKLSKLVASIRLQPAGATAAVAPAGGTTAPTGTISVPGLPLLSERGTSSSRAMTQGERQVRGLQEGGKRTELGTSRPSVVDDVNMELLGSAPLTGADTARRAVTRTRSVADVLYRSHRPGSPMTKARTVLPAATACLHPFGAALLAGKRVRFSRH